MLIFQKSGVEFKVEVPNRCFFCFAKLIDKFDGTVGDNVIPKYSRGISAKEFPVADFQQAWRHLVPQHKDQILFSSRSPPLCGICGTILEKIPATLKQLFASTNTINSRIKQLGGKNETNKEEKKASFLEDFKSTELRTDLMRETLNVLEMLGHGPFQTSDNIEVKQEIEEITDLEPYNMEMELDNLTKVIKSENTALDPLQDDGTESCPSKVTVKRKVAKVATVPQEFFDEEPFYLPKKRIRPTKPKSCDFCGGNVGREEMLEHVRSHVGDLAMPCPNPSCKNAFSNISRFRAHLKRSSSCTPFLEKDIFSCELCSYKAYQVQTLQSHLSLVHESAAEKTHSCPVPNCSHRFAFRQTVQCHIVSHTSSLKVVPPQFQACPECGSHLPQAEVQGHLINSHGVAPDSIIFCNHCPYAFPSREKLLDHLIHHIKSGIPVACDLCKHDNKFLGMRALRSHYWSAHQVGCERVICEQKHCSKSFPNMESMQKHVKAVHSGQVKLRKCMVKCPDCPGQEFVGERGLICHKIKVHGATPFKCQFCGEEFRDWNAFRRHENSHRGLSKLTYPCDIPGCGKTFSSKVYLDVHKTSVEHVGETNAFVCTECGKGFNHEVTLKNHHNAVHLKERNFVCEDCGESFKHGIILKRHKLIHTGERPFQCEICLQRFRYKEGLKVHVNSHQTKGANFKPSGPMKKVRKRVNPK